MDKNGRLFGKISIIDLFVILLIAGIVAGVIFRFGFSGSVARNNDATIAYTFRIGDGVRDFTLEYYERAIGTTVYERFSGNPIGVITAVRSEQAYSEHILFDPNVPDDERLVIVARPGVLIIYIYIETQGFVTERSYFTEESFELRMGGTNHFFFRYVSVQGSITEINIIE